MCVSVCACLPVPVSVCAYMHMIYLYILSTGEERWRGLSQRTEDMTINWTRQCPLKNIIFFLYSFTSGVWTAGMI